MPRILQGIPVILSGRDIDFLQSLEDAATYIGGIKVNVEQKETSNGRATIPPYRVRQLPKSCYLAQVIVWTNRPPAPQDCFGEAGDLWVSIPKQESAQLYVRNASAAWTHILRNVTEGIIKHPVIQNRELALNGGQIIWYNSSQARRTRHDLKDANMGIANPILLRVLYKALTSHLQTRSREADPPLFPQSDSETTSGSMFSGEKDTPIETIAELADAVKRYQASLILPTSSLSDDHPLLFDRQEESPSNLQTCIWWNRLRTILPFVVDDKADGDVETPDLCWTRWAAEVSGDATLSPAPTVDPPVRLVELSEVPPQGKHRFSILQTIRETLSQGRCVCVKPFHDPNAWTWSEETFATLAGSLDAEVDWVDAATRRDEFRNPARDGETAHFHETGSVRKFLAKSDKSWSSVNMMDIPLFSVPQPWFVNEISDDLLALRATKTVGYSLAQDCPGPQYFPFDVARMGAWALATTGGFFTDIHHDSNGAATWVTVSSGAKIWILLTPRHTDPPRLMQALYRAATMHQQADPRELEEDFYVTSILLEPGSVLIQPPGQFHAVYTPTKTIMYGGHLLLYDTLHQTLLTRRLEYLTNHCATNASHPGIDRLLTRMVLALQCRAGSDICVYHIHALAELLLHGRSLYSVTPPEGKKRKRPAAASSEEEALRERCAALDVLRTICDERHLPLRQALDPQWVLRSLKINIPSFSLKLRLESSDLIKVQQIEEEDRISVQSALKEWYSKLAKTTLAV